MTERNKKEQKTYTIAVRGSGGEIHLGEISPKAAAYWVNRGSEELSSYIWMPDGNDLEPDDPDLQLGSWNDYCLIHEYGFDCIDKVIVSDEHKEVTRVDGSYLADYMVQASIPDSSTTEGSSGPFVIARTSEEGTIVFQVTTSEPFNFDRLRFSKVKIQRHTLITNILYNGKPLEWEEYFERNDGFEAEIVDRNRL